MDGQGKRTCVFALSEPARVTVTGKGGKTRAIADAAPAIVSEGTGWLTEERKAALYSLK